MNSIYVHHGLNVCVLTDIHVLNPNYQGADVWEITDSVLVNGINDRVVIYIMTPEACLRASTMGYSVTNRYLKSWKSPSLNFMYMLLSSLAASPKSRIVSQKFEI